MWQWLHHKVKLDDGQVITREHFGRMLTEEMDKLRRWGCLGVISRVLGYVCVCVCVALSAGEVQLQWCAAFFLNSPKTLGLDHSVSTALCPNVM